MINDKVALLESVDPEVLDRMASRRETLLGGAGLGKALALASVPAVFAVSARNAFAQDGGGLPQEVVDVLNFALTLEFLEAGFYQKALDQQGLIPDDKRGLFETIASHEQAHVDFLRQQLGEEATKEPQFDFTAGGMFDTFEKYPTFLLVSQAFEDTGVRAYKGQASNLVGMDEVLTAALKIHSVEARHAAAVRRERDIQGWIPFSQPDVPKPVAPVYQGMGETTKFDVDLKQASKVDPKQITESYDEPLTKDEVLSIVKPFLAS